MTAIKRHEIPIAIRALKTANIYEIFSNRHILVDTGMSPETIPYLEQRGVDLASLDMVIMTHLHIDHIGGAEAIHKEYNIPLAMGIEDIRRVDQIRESPESFQKFLMSFMTLNGTPEGILTKMVSHHSVLDNIGTYKDIDFEIKLKGNEKVDDGISVIHNPGHSPGSMSVYIENDGKLLTGDHLLPGITPNISFYDENSDMLGLYMDSLKKTLKLEPNEILPGHRDPFGNSAERVHQILKHHDERLGQILLAVKEWKTAYEVARIIPWSKGRTLDSMNLLEMNFAIGEAISHLRHLTIDGNVEKRERNGLVEFRSAQT